MELRQLRYFIATAEELSISRAARRLRLAQPALSQQIRHLEDEFAVKLLKRNSRGVQLTAAGERLLVEARAIVQRAAALPGIICGRDGELVGEVRIGLPGTVAEILAVPMMMRCRKEHPRIDIKVQEAMSGYVRDWLTKGNVDLAILYSTANTLADGIAVHEVLTEEVCLFAAPGLLSNLPDPFPFRELARFDLILPSRSNGLRQLIEQYADHANVTFTNTVEIDSYSQIKRLVAKGVGVGLLPRMAIQSEVRDGVLQASSITEPALERRVFLAWSQERRASEATEAVGCLAWDTLRRLVKTGAWEARLAPDIMPEIN